MNVNPRPLYPKPKPPPYPPSKSTLAVQVFINRKDYMQNKKESKPNEGWDGVMPYETFLMHRESFIEVILNARKDLLKVINTYSPDTIKGLPDITRKDLIDLASNPVDFATLQKVIAVLSASIYLSVELEEKT